MIRLGTKKITPFYEDYKPVEVRRNNVRIAGWLTETKSGEAVDFENTYNDTADVIVKGKSLQKSEWVHKQGLTTQQTWTGKNLFSSELEMGTISLETGLNIPSSEAKRSAEFTTVTPNTQYTISRDVAHGSFYIHEYDSDNVQVKYSSTYALSLTFTTSVNTVSIKVRTGNTVSTIQLELGATATSYEPYVGGIPAPNPGFPQPLVSNLPAGTYKTQDWKGDWWEFTLTEDLCGIDDVRDSVEWDKYSHKGGEKRQYGKYVFDGTNAVWDGIYRENETSGYFATNSLDSLIFEEDNNVVAKGFCSHAPVVSLDTVFDTGTTQECICLTGRLTYKVRFRIRKDRLSDTTTTAFNTWLSSNPVKIVYRLATPTRTPLTFTKNNASTAPECPMEFLTDTPSLEYPAEVFDASGTVKVRGKNLLPFPLDLETYTVAHYGSPPKTSSTQTDEFVRIQGAEEVTDTAFRIVSPTFPLNPNTTYTISFKAYVDSPTFTSWDMVSTWGVALVSQSGVRLSEQQYLNTVQKTWTTYKFVATTNSEGLYYLRLGADGPNLIDGFILIDRHSIQIEEGSTATPYVPYRPEVSAPIPPLRSNADGTVYDEFEVNTGKLTRKIGRIESYNGEDVGDDWISSTGALDTGATVEYVLAEPIITHIDPVTVPTYPWYTRIEQDGAVKGTIEARVRVME